MDFGSLEIDIKGCCGGRGLSGQVYAQPNNARQSASNTQQDAQTFVFFDEATLKNWLSDGQQGIFVVGQEWP